MSFYESFYWQEKRDNGRKTYKKSKTPKRVKFRMRASKFLLGVCLITNNKIDRKEAIFSIQVKKEVYGMLEKYLVFGSKLRFEGVVFSYII